MAEDMIRFGKSTIYQISLRVFTPEGTIRAAQKLLEHVQRLGPKYIQLNPVALADDDMDQTYWSKRQKASRTGNPKNTYRIRDYFAVDDEYGTEEDLQAFVAEAHARGLKVIFDLVYYHCGPRAVFLEEHPDFVLRNEDGSFKLGGWAFPVFNFENPAVREYLWRNMVWYVERFDADGFRCDVGDMVPMDFWAEGARRVRAIKPGFLMLNEGSRHGEAFDVCYFYDGFNELPAAARGETTAAAFMDKWEMARAARPAGKHILHMIDNHDICSDGGEARHEKTVGTAAVDAMLVTMFMLDGVPFVFNGYEAADDLKHNMFASRFFKPDPAINWANMLTEKGRRRFELLRQLFALRNSSDDLASADLIRLPGGSENVIAFVRPGRESHVAVVNLSAAPVSVALEGVPAAQPVLENGAERGEGAVSLAGWGYYVGKF